MAVAKKAVNPEKVAAHEEVHKRLQLSPSASKDEIIEYLRKVADQLALEWHRSRVALVEAARETVDNEGTVGGMRARMRAIDRWDRAARKSIKDSGAQPMASGTPKAWRKRQ